MKKKTDSGLRLERALEVFLASPVTTADEATRLLEQHPDLRDLLEPMLAGRPTLAETDEDQVLGDYRLVREIGRGGMGVVHEAWQRSLDRRVAVKVLAAGLVQSPGAVARFRREAAAAGRLRHPNIVEVFGFGSEEGRHFFAMQFVEGMSLHDRRRDFRDPGRAVALIEQLVDALAHAHTHGLVHRDVKPANVLVLADGSPMLTDFGIASDAALPSLTREGGFVGTLDYASPEQIRGELIDARTDVWAVGVILHELLTGSHPFAGATQEATISNILTREPPSPHKSPHKSPHERRAISSDLAAVVGRALERDRRRRYATADALLADLRALQTGAAVSARLPGTTERMVRWARREPWRAAVAAILVVAVPVVAGATGYLWANAPRIEAAAAAEAFARREEAMAQAWLLAHEESIEAGLEALERVTPADAEVAVSRALMLLAMKRPGDARAALQSYTGIAVDLMLASIDGRTATRDETRLRPLDAFEHFVRANLLFLHDGGEPSSTSVSEMKQQVDAARSAVALAPSPRLNYLSTWLRAADLARDVADMNNAERALAKHFPDSPLAQRRRAQVLAQTSPEQALQLLAEPDAHPGATSRFWLLRGVAHETLRQLDEAVAANRRAVAADPNSHSAWHNLGVCLRKQKSYAEAVQANRRAVELRPIQPGHWNSLGLALRAAGELDEADRAFEKALELAPHYGSPAYNMGNLRMGRGDLEGAIAAFERAVANDPRDVKHFANLGDALARAGRKQESLRESIRATMVAPNDLIPHYNVARLAIELGLPELALVEARHARDLDRKGGDGLTIHALALLAQEPVDAPKALADAREADNRHQGKDLETKLVLARALEAANDRFAAIALLEATQRDPQFANSESMATVVTHLDRLRAAR